MKLFISDQLRVRVIPVQSGKIQSHINEKIQIQGYLSPNLAGLVRGISRYSGESFLHSQRKRKSGEIVSLDSIIMAHIMEICLVLQNGCQIRI